MHRAKRTLGLDRGDNSADEWERAPTGNKSTRARNRDKTSVTCLKSYLLGERVCRPGHRDAYRLDTSTDFTMEILESQYYRIRTALLQGAQGMWAPFTCIQRICHSWGWFSRFRWAALQLDELRRCSSPHEVEEQLLVRLPKDLNRYYDQIIHRIDGRDHKDARKFFEWLAFSIRPLSLVELAEVVTVDLESQDGAWFDLELRYFNSTDVLGVCSSFISITEGKANLSRPKSTAPLTGCSDKVKLSHPSVKEYLLSDHALQSTPSLHITETASHLHISKTCLAYLGQFDRRDSLDDSLQANPLAYYAAKHWIDHATSGGDVDQQRLVSNIFQHPHVFVNWVRIWDIGRSAELPLYASLAGVQALLENGEDVNADAFQAAMSRAHESIVKLLLDKGKSTPAHKYASQRRKNGHWKEDGRRRRESH